MNASLRMAGKIAKPPPFPIDVFERVLRVAMFDGRLLTIIAGTFAIMAAVGHNAPPTIAGVIAAGWGLCEIHGANQLRNGDPRGLNLMIVSQVGLMLTVFGYAGWMMIHLDPMEVINTMPDFYREDFESKLAASGITAEQVPAYMKTLTKIAYTMVAGLTFVFQGMMARFYLKARPAVNTVIFGRNAP
ncbi:MAG: hypothetical protein SynsKO_16430 [Synoicihabitans sp.]